MLELRESLLGYSSNFVARHASISGERLAEIEAGEPAALDELDRLASLYGLDPEQLEDEPIVLAPGDSIGALPSLDEFRELGDIVRLRIIRAASAARELIALERLAEPEGPSRAQRFLSDAPSLRIQSTAASHRQGASLAASLRRKLELGVDPIASVRDFVSEYFPMIAVLHADLTASGPAGLAFADNYRGPAIVLNTRGKNENPTVRRFSLAHELCHLLVDWNRQEPIARISGYLHDSRLDEERRANAFAIRLLCPEAIVHKLEPDSPSEQVKIIASFGIPYSAIRIYLKNEAGTDIAPRPPIEVQRSTVDSKWSTAEGEPTLNDFPLQDVPPERRTLVARTAASLYSGGKLQRDAFAESLGVTPAHEVERVLDFYEVPWPSDERESSGAA
ncbi:hypothetical protein DB30_00081 [Enhygromyxa salina]|uniref:IrrE N-terminal-like domain-containing protein n=1 Tax=Enhygromyxa salina TaxID=215803 RepID=A0A0C2DIQ7_9BACT|nr:hypothetical protein DB30_00081 [Enhygromyxa salina]